MGRIKDEIIKKEEKDWVEENQEILAKEESQYDGFIYADLIDEDLINDPQLIEISIGLVDGTNYIFNKDDIIEWNGVSIKFIKTSYDNYRVFIIPFNKIVKIYYSITR